MPIPVTTPTDITAVFDHWTISSIQIIGDGLAEFGKSMPSKIIARASLIKCRTRPDNVIERSPLPTDRIDLHIDDLAALITTNSDMQTVLPLLTKIVVDLATEQHKL